MEFQLQSYAFATNDELNDMTFYNYKMNYRSQDSIFGIPSKLKGISD